MDAGSRYAWHEPVRSMRFSVANGEALVSGAEGHNPTAWKSG